MMSTDEFDLEVFIANLAARLVGNRISNTESLEFNWRSKILSNNSSSTDCAFIDITFQPTKARFGSLYYSETGSVYHTAEPLTQQAIQAHFGEQVDTQSTKAEVLAKMMAKTLLNNSIRASSEGVYLIYDGFCGARRVLCEGAETANLPQFATKMVVLQGQRRLSPEDHLSEETIASAAETLLSRWRKNVTPPSHTISATGSEAALSVAEVGENPPKSLGDSEIEHPTLLDKKQPTVSTAPQPEAAKKKRANVKSRVKKKKKRSGGLSFVDDS